jgi:hypothetical protein
MNALLERFHGVCISDSQEKQLFLLCRKSPIQGFLLSFDEDRRTICSSCGKFVPAGNSYCRYCGTAVSRFSSSSRTIELIGGTASAPVQQYPHYDRKFSAATRIMKLLTSPKEAMEDIGLAPDYGGVILLFAIWTIIAGIALVISLLKIRIVGSYSTELSSIVASGLALTMLFVPIIFIVRWLIKSYLIRYLCDDSYWDFHTAASVTGYAYFPNIIFTFIGVFVSWMVFPSIVIDTTNLEQALVQMQQFKAQIAWFAIGLSTVYSLIAWIWKSYLGSLGAYSGTHQQCERGAAFGNFLVIGGIGVLIDFVGNFL